MTFPKVTSRQMAEVDRRVVEDYGISVMQMMENAARSVADVVREEVGNVQGKKIVALAGKGNNGGDAVAAVRHLHNAGAEVSVILASPVSEMNELGQQQVAVVKKMGVRVVEYPGDGIETAFALMRESDVVIDGLLGYNISGNPKGSYAELINFANDTSEDILSFDLPSGLDPDTGEPHDPTITAKWTVTLALPKVGLMKDAAKEYVGDLWLADISVPNELYREMGIEVKKIFNEKSVLKL